MSSNFPFDMRERVAFFVDGANFYQTARNLNVDIDYRRMLTSFVGDAYLLRAHYYTAMADDQEFSSLRPLIDWLDYNGFQITTKPMREFTDNSGQRRRVRPSLDVDLTVDAMTLADSINHLVLFSGDGNYLALVEALQKKGVKVTVVSSLKTTPSMVSDDLRRTADHFLDLADLTDRLGRDPSERPARRERFDDDDDEYDDYDD
ncbi:NYN domain-containing protein [Ahrensia marina]|uniref:LabA-like NYN domain-containing protein n=1 Tax=Ahrensia marina TaxID=1514904 RepID=UPI0035D0265E